MFALFSRYKREAYRHSQFAPKILNDVDIPVIMKASYSYTKHEHPDETFIIFRVTIPQSYLVGYSTRPSKLIIMALPRPPLYPLSSPRLRGP